MTMYRAGEGMYLCVCKMCGSTQCATFWHMKLPVPGFRDVFMRITLTKPWLSC